MSCTFLPLPRTLSLGRMSGYTALGNFRKKHHPTVFDVGVHLCCLATALHLFWFFIMFRAGQTPLVPSAKHRRMVPSWWNILSQIPMHGYDWKRRPEREVPCYALDLWRQFEGILQQEANSQGQAGPKGRGVAKAPGWEQFYSHSSLFSKNPKLFHMDRCFPLPSPEYHTSTEWGKEETRNNKVWNIIVSQTHLPVKFSARKTGRGFHLTEEKLPSIPK